MIVEPAAGDRVEDNLNPIGRAYYAFSTVLCARLRCPRTSGSRWAHRPAKPGSGTWSSAPVSAGSTG
jgi:hypothetical protein